MRGSGRVRAGVTAALVAVLVSCGGASRRSTQKEPPPADPVFVAHRARAEEFLRRAWVHAPVREGRCVACHDPLKAARDTVKPVPELCYPCHQKRKKDQGRKFVHVPFQLGECGTCHDPHASDQPALLSSPVLELCTTCHQPDGEEIRKSHGGIVVASVSCASCHSPHASDREKLVWSEGLHPPFADAACSMCHDEPSAEGVVKLNAADGSFCFACHADVEAARTAAVPHPPFAQGLCWTCHDPHRSPRSKFLKEKLPVLCRTCHESIPATGHPVARHASFKEGIMNPKDPTTPFDCGACHHPHGSEHAALRRFPPATFCGACHPW